MKSNKLLKFVTQVNSYKNGYSVVLENYIITFFNSCENILKLVSGLFSYNDFAKSFLLGETKCAR